MKAGWKEFIYRIGIKSIILGILLWGLVPTSVWMTNKVNETYAKSYDMDFTLEDTEKLLDKDNDSASAGTEIKCKRNHWLYNHVLRNRVGTAASEKIDAIEKGLNKILEGVAVMIVTTCAIPVLVMLTFVWILKSITGLKLPNITQQSIPKVSEMKRKKKAEIDG